MNNILEISWVQSVISALLIAGTILSIFTPEWEFAQFTSEFTVHYMVGLLGLGLLFLSLNAPRLLFISFACCASLCIFLKNASNSHLILPDLNLEPKISIAHVNVGNIENGFEELDLFINEYDPDILSLQEVTPEWGMYIQQELRKIYPHQNVHVRIDPYGMALLSKSSLSTKDTFNYGSIPNLMSGVMMGGREVMIFSSYLYPPLGKSSTETSKEHLDVISSKLSTYKKPVISLGDFNMVYWSNVIRDFRNETKLLNSRRDFTPLGFRIPHDHIFYSPKLECTEFKEHRNENSEHFGIYGIYQFKTQQNVEDIKAALGYLEE